MHQKLGGEIDLGVEEIGADFGRLAAARRLGRGYTCLTHQVPITIAARIAS